jgi:hypothetical protein
MSISASRSASAVKVDAIRGYEAATGQAESATEIALEEDIARTSCDWPGPPRARDERSRT